MHLQEENTQLDDLKAIENEKFFVLEEQIDIDLQAEYFKLSKKLKNQVEQQKAIDDFGFIYDNNLSLNAKKHILVALASVDDVSAYRLLEAYKDAPREELRDWATLAFNESRMLMESSLSNEKQVFISTGMGGKGECLRYFMALFPSDVEFTDFQKNFVVSEVEFTFKQHKAEIELIQRVSPKFVSFIVLVPIKASIEKLMHETFDACNQFDKFLDDKFIITNVKALSEEEVMQFALEEELKLSNEDFEFEINED